VEQNRNLSRALELVDLVLRNWWTVVAGLCIGLAVAHVAVKSLQKVFEAHTLIFAASEKLPEEMIARTVSDDTAVRVAGLSAAVRSRDVLLPLIEKTIGLPANPEEAERLVYRVASGVRFTHLPRQASVDVAFRDTNPRRAAILANALADAFVAENTRFRSYRAGETAEMLEQLANNAMDKLSAKEREIAELRAEHPYSTTDQLPVLVQLMQQHRTELAANEVTVAELRERLRVMEFLRDQESALEIMMDEVSGRTRVGTSRGTDTDSGSDLAQMEAELRDLLSRLTENHPDVLAKKRDIENLRRSQGAAQSPPESGAAAPESPTDEPVNPYDIKIIEVEAEIRALLADNRRIRAEIAEYQDRISSMPEVEQQLDSLIKETEVLRAKYNELRSKVESAGAARTIEEANVGNQFEVIRRAAPPSVPAWPEPTTFHTAGAIVGLLLFVGPMLAKRLLWPVIASDAGLRAVSDLPVFTSIPEIATPLTTKRDRRRRWVNFGLSFLAASGLVATVALVQVMRTL
jgi:polysaccharide chain length determinant protein (PEP-CTERM system associated)